VECKPAARLCREEGEWYPALHEVKYCLQNIVKGCHPSPLLSNGEATSEVLSPVLGSSEQERQGHTGESPAKGHEDD